MFDIAWPELMIIAVVALVVIGPKDLPKVLRTAGRYVRQAQRLAREFQGHVDEFVRESELEEIRAQARKLAMQDPAHKVAAFVDPEGQVGAAFKDPTVGLANPLVPQPATAPAAPQPELCPPHIVEAPATPAAGVVPEIPKPDEAAGPIVVAEPGAKG